MARIIRDLSPGAHAVSVPCLACGRMLRLCDALIDADGPSFKAYYHTACAPAPDGERLIPQEPK